MSRWRTVRMTNWRNCSICSLQFICCERVFSILCDCRQFVGNWVVGICLLCGSTIWQAAWNLHTKCRNDFVNDLSARRACCSCSIALRTVSRARRVMAQAPPSSTLRVFNCNLFMRNWTWVQFSWLYKLNSTTRTRPDPHGPNGVSPQKKSLRVRAGPVGSVSGPCSGI